MAHAFQDQLAHVAAEHRLFPLGTHITDDDAVRLIAAITLHGRLQHSADLDDLLDIMERAPSVSMKLVLFALNEVKSAIITGEGPLRIGTMLDENVVDEGDVVLLRRILCAAGDFAITSEEADILYAINDATEIAGNDGTWPDFFAKAIGNHFIMASGYAPESRRTVLADGEWLDRHTSVAVQDLSARMAMSLRNVHAAATSANASQTGYEETRWQIADSERSLARAANWLGLLIERVTPLDDAERAAVLTIRKDENVLHPKLKQLLDKVA